MPRNSYHDTPVVEFHEAFGAPVAWKPTVPPADRIELRLRLIFEEAIVELSRAVGLDPSELETAFEIMLRTPPGAVDLISVADSLTDARYVIDGACLEFGLPAEKLLREAHRSNMSKLGPDGKPILREDGKILKGPNFTLPDLKSILDLYSQLPNAGVKLGSEEC
ncbi:MAG: hypothetical protein E6Q97_36105 [Desulfurellales bacterium]|nr:MAG: hypothetical protein E6Q97_36105 [Desulfurellales bacterium]